MSWVKNGGLGIIKAVSNYRAEHMSYRIDGTAMPGVVNVEYSHQNIVD